MKVMHVIPKIKKGGVEAAVLSSYDYLHKEGIDFTILSIEKGELPPNDCSIISLDSNLLSLFTYFKFIKILINEKPDLIVFSLWKSSLLGLLWFYLNKFIRYRINTALIIHSSRFAHFIDRAVTTLAVKKFDRIYFDSLSTSKLYREKGVTGNVLSFILNECKTEFKEKSLSLSFVFIGRLHAVKNLSSAITFIKKLKEQGLEPHFDIYGPDEGEEKQLKKIIENYNLQTIVNIKGPIDKNEVSLILNQYTFYLQFSNYEGMAISVVEAMQHGLIPCVTNVGEIPNYAVDNYNSLLFETGKMHSEHYLTDKARELAELFKSPKKMRDMSMKAYHSFDKSSSYKQDYLRLVINQGCGKKNG